MTISGLPPYTPAIPARPASPASPQPGSPEGATKAASTTTVRGSSLWQVLTPDEKAFFLGASAASALGYGPNGGASNTAEPCIGQHLDVTA